MFILPCMFLFSACGSNPPDDNNPPPHTHTWSSTYTKTETEHYKTCSGCDETSERANHSDNPCSVCGYDTTHTHTFTPNDYEYNDNYHWQQCTTCSDISDMVAHQMDGITCTVCGYVNLYDTVFSMRDLEITTYQTENGGTFTLVKLPDGKNMLIDTSTSVRADKTQLRRALLNEEATNNITIDYFVLTNTIEERCANAYYVLTTYEVGNVYLPNTTGVGYTIESTSSFSQAKEYAITNMSDKLNIVSDTMQDITNTFTYGGTQYSYTIDFMTPVAPENCTDAADSSVFVAITYKDKTILLTGDTTNNSIDSYAVVNGNPKYTHNVDVLITGYNAGHKDAVRLSGVRGSGFLADIGLTSSDYAIITNLGATSGIDNCVASITPYTQNIKSTAAGYSTVTVKVTNTGDLTVATTSAS